MTTLIREHTPTARKTHACSLCDGLIAAGEQYTRFTVIAVLASEQVVHGDAEEQQAAKNYLNRYYTRRGDAQ